MKAYPLSTKDTSYMKKSLALKRKYICYKLLHFSTCYLKMISREREREIKGEGGGVARYREHTLPRHIYRFKTL